MSRRIDTDEEFSQSVIEGVASGDSVWLDVASQLKPTSAAAEASLDIALASALPRAPHRVLALIGDEYPAEEVCGIPFLKADSNAVTAYYDQAVRAISAVSDSALTGIVPLCRTALDSARSRRLQRIDPAYIKKNKPAPARR